MRVLQLYVYAWGDSDKGGTAPANVTALTDVATAMCGGNACVAVTRSKEVFAWGDSKYGGTAPAK
jgi:alpha-tubulin suppressor-like RCC1 family protein